MSARIEWQPFRDELQRWADGGRTARFWFRDDDAIEPTPALDRLLALHDRFSVPMTLAVIPAFTGDALVARLADEKDLVVTVHGWTHENHSPDTEKKQELGAHRPQAVVLAELARGFEKLADLYPGQFVPMLVPPWNRIDKALLPGLAPIGFRAVSVYGPAKSGPLAQVNTHVDIMEWHGVRGGRPHRDLVQGLVQELKRRFDGSDEPIGVLTHHLVHDDTAWDFITALFEETAGHVSVEWRSVRDFLT